MCRLISQTQAEECTCASTRAENERIRFLKNNSGGRNHCTTRPQREPTVRLFKTNHDSGLVEDLAEAKVDDVDDGGAGEDGCHRDGDDAEHGEASVDKLSLLFSSAVGLWRSGCVFVSEVGLWLTGRGVAVEKSGTQLLSSSVCCLCRGPSCGKGRTALDMCACTCTCMRACACLDDGEASGC